MSSPASTHPVAGEVRTWQLRGWAGIMLAVVCVAGFGLAARLLAEDESRLWYAAFLAAFFVLYAVVWSLPRLPRFLKHLILVIQVLVVMAMLIPESDFDYITGYYVLLAYQTAFVFSGRVRWVWIGLLMALVAVSLAVTQGAVERSATNIAVGLAVAALVVAGQEIEAARAKSREMLRELENANEELRRYSAEVEELAALQERNRLARELHDSVSQSLFGIQLAARSAQLMHGKDPIAAQEQLERLQELTDDALARMRGFIADLRPKS
jgi:signal transduction histidine kinase